MGRGRIDESDRKRARLDRSRGQWGEAADDVSCLAINYIYYAIQETGGFEGIDATGNRRHFRILARERLGEFAEVYVKCPVQLCKARERSRDQGDVQEGLYEKAERGELEGGLPGVSAPYEPPLHAEVEVASDVLTAKEAALKIMEYVSGRWLIGNEAL